MDLDKLTEDEFADLLLGDDMGFISSELAKHQIVRPVEVMKLLGVSRATLYRWIKGGDFPRPKAVSTRVTGWPEHEVAAWLDARGRTRRAG